MFGHSFAFKFNGGLLAGGFNPLTDIAGLSLYLNKNTNVNTKISADFVAANSEYLSSSSVDFDKTTSDDFSFGGWFKFDRLTIAETLIGKWGGASDKGFFLYKSSTNKIYLYHSTIGSDAVLLDTLYVVTTATWYFISVVFDGTNGLKKVSFNGGAFITASCTTLFNSTQDLTFAAADGSSFLDGSIDAPFFYDKALSLAEVNALYNLDNGTSYPSLSDLNGTQYAIGQSLNGSTDAFNIDSLLTPLASTTTGEWEIYHTPVDATPTSADYLIAFGDTDANTRFCIFNNTGGQLHFLLVIAGVTKMSVITDAAVFSDGVQAKINIIQNGTALKLKINDVEVAQTDTSTEPTFWFNNASGLDNGRMGCLNFNSGGNASFTATTIQNVKIWSDATQTTQVAEYLMNDVEGADQVDTIGAYNGTPIGTPVSTLASVDNTTIATIESSLVSWWDLNEESGTRNDAHGTNNLTDNNTVGYALGKVQDTSTVGERVWNWIDQSSNAYIFSNDTVTAQPLLGGGGSVDFDGTDDLLEIVVADAFGSDARGSFFFSGYHDGTSQIFLASADVLSASKYFQFGISSAGEINFQFRGSVFNQGVSDSTVPIGYFEAELYSDSSAYKLILNGVESTISFAIGSNDGAWTNTVTLRTSVTLGVRKRSTITYSTAKMNKIIYSNATLTTNERASIRNFMSNPNK